MDLKNGMVIRCNSKEEAQEFIKEAYKQGFKWVNYHEGDEEKTCWGYVCDFNSEIYYHLEADEITWSSMYSGNNSIEYSTLKEKIKTMTKSELKNGMVVELQNKGMYLVHNGMLLNQKGTGHMSLYCRRGYYGEYNEDLTRPNDSNWDIIRVYKSDAHNLKDMFAKDSLELIWEREEKQELSNEDKQIIKKGLKKIQEECKRHKFCYGCMFDDNGQCLLDDIYTLKIDKLFEE